MKKWLVRFEHCSDDGYDYDRVLDQEADAWAWAAAVALIFRNRCEDLTEDLMWNVFKKGDYAEVVRSFCDDQDRGGDCVLQVKEVPV